MASPYFTEYLIESFKEIIDGVIAEHKLKTGVTVDRSVLDQYIDDRIEGAIKKIDPEIIKECVRESLHYYMISPHRPYWDETTE